MKMPRQRPHRSEQSVQTDPRLIAAVVRRWGPLAYDLAADATNRQAPLYVNELVDSLSLHWLKLGPGNRWLNPPFGNIAPWAKKCSEEAAPDRRVFLHVPASTGANWFRDYVWGKAYICFLSGRVTYVGHTTCYPKDTIVAVYGDMTTVCRIPARRVGAEVWEWLARAA